MSMALAETCRCPTCPSGPPFVLRARVLTPLGQGGTRYESDGAWSWMADGRIAERRALEGVAARSAARVRPASMVLLPGMVDLHVHLPQVPAAGVGAGLDLLTWLERHIFSSGAAFRAPVAEAWCPPSIGRWLQPARPPSWRTAPSGPTVSTRPSGQRRRTASGRPLAR